MSKECKRVRKRRTDWLLSDAPFNALNILSNGHKYPIAEVLSLTNNRLIVRENDGEIIRSKSPYFSSKNHECKRPKEALRHLKRCRYSRKSKNRARSRRRQNASERKQSKSQEDSSDSSSSSSDLRSKTRHANRHILSRLVQYTFYFVVNTGVAMDQGTSTSVLCRSFLALYLKLDESSVYSNLLEAWDKAGQRIIVLKGYNHKHLQYLAKEVRHVAVESNTLYRTTGQARVMLALTAFGREEDMEEAFDDLCYLH